MADADNTKWKVYRPDWYNDRVLETYISSPIVDKQNDKIKTETIIIDKDSEELVYLIELSTKDNSPTDVEDFTQSITEFIKNTESPAVYGYFISKDNKKVTLIERWRNSQDAIQHGLDFINGKNFDRFFEVFELSSFIFENVTVSPSPLSAADEISVVISGNH